MSNLSKHDPTAEGSRHRRRLETFCQEDLSKKTQETKKKSKREGSCPSTKIKLVCHSKLLLRQGFKNNNKEGVSLVVINLIFPSYQIIATTVHLISIQLLTSSNQILEYNTSCLIFIALTQRGQSLNWKAKFTTEPTLKDSPFLVAEETFWG